jgi:hypothetical protein
MAIQIGSKVKYNRNFLNNIHADKTDDIWRETGIVEEIKGEGKTKRAVVVWEDETTNTALLSNLTILD